MNNPVLSIQSLTLQTTNRLLLDAVDLEIRTDEKLLLQGPNGSGKSSLLQTASGLQSPIDPAVTYPSLSTAKPNLKSLAKVRHWIGQNEKRPDHLSVREYLELGRELGDSALYEKWAGLLHVQELQNQNLQSLSGGEWSRVRLVFGLSQRVELLLLDEVDAALDGAYREVFYRALLQSDLAVLAVSHDKTTANRGWDRVIEIRNRQLAQVNQA